MRLCCAPTRPTYTLKTVETTNSLMLVEARISCGCAPSIQAVLPRIIVREQADGRLGLSQAQPIIVAATADRHIDLTQTAPQLERLSTAMQASLSWRFGGPQQKPAGNANWLQATAVGRPEDAAGEAGEAAGVPFDRLLGQYQVWSAHTHRAARTGAVVSPLSLQASSTELQAELAKVGAVDLGAGWQGVHPEYLATLLEMVVLTAAQHAWPLTALPLPALCEALAQDGYDAR